MHNDAEDDITLDVETFGKLSVHKLSDKGENLAGVTFGVFTNAACTVYAKDQSNNNVTMVTESDGRATSPDLLPQTFYVKEIDMTAAQYELFNLNPTVYQVSVQGGATTPINANAGQVVNNYKTVTIQINKQNADPDFMTYNLSGAVFRIRNTTTNQSWTVTTNAVGLAENAGILMGLIEIEEITAPYGFQRNPTIYTYDLRKGQKNVDIILQQCTVPEYPQRGKITITKYDSETGATPQGDASLRNAQFEIVAKTDITYYSGLVKYRAGEVVQTLDCGADSTSVTSMELPLGRYLIRETRPPVGMNPTDAEVEVAVESFSQEVRVNFYDAGVYNDVIKGKIAVLKHGEEDADPSTPGVQNPLANVDFRVWLVSAGSFDAAKPSERAAFTTSETGYGETGWLPYGLYRVEEQRCAANEGRELVKPFDIFVGTDGKVYYLYLQNDYYEAYLRIVKTDAETGKTIPAAGYGYQIYEGDRLVTQTIMYPVVTEISTFYTSSDGTLVTPQPLPYSPVGYRLVEVQSGYGYTLNPDPLYFNIDDGTETILELKFSNTPVKGIIEVEKTGAMLTGSTETDTDYGVQYTPVYEQTGADGVVLDVIAEEDIVTGDGTVRYTRDQVVDTLVTVDGKAQSKQLYLGKYRIVERDCGAHPFVLLEEPVSVALEFENQHVPVVSSAVTLKNIRQQVQVRVQKHMEVPDGADDAAAYYADVLFGLFAEADIMDITGAVAIPKDGLIALLTVDETGLGELTADLPFTGLYVRELRTNGHYESSGTVYPILPEYRGGDAPVSVVEVNGDDPIENRLLRGSLRIIKSFEGRDTPIAGVPFTVAGETNLGTTYYGEFTTAEDGTILVEGLLPGRYTVVELSSELTEGYVLSEAQTIEVIPDTIAEMEIGNIIIRGHVRLVKADAEYLDRRLSGAVFTVYRDDGDREWNSADEPAGYLEETEAGLYELRNLLYGGYFLVEEFSPELFAADANPHYFDIVLDGETVVVQNHESGLFINQPQRGSLRIVKTSSNGVVEGFSFRVAGPDYDRVFTTDGNGEIFVEGLRAGSTYTVSEEPTDASAGYILPDAKTVTISEDTTVEIRFHNQELPPPPDTGVPMSAWPLPAALLSAIPLLCARRKGHNRGV